LDSADEARAQPLDRSGQLDVIQALCELTEDHLQLEPGKIGPQAEVLADSKRQMRVRVARDVEAERSVEDFLIAVGRGIEQAQRLAGLYFLAADLGVFRGGARELDHRRGPSHD